MIEIRLKLLVLICAAVISFQLPGALYASTNASMYGPSVGLEAFFNMSRFPNDIKAELSLTSPHVLYNAVALRISAGVDFSQGRTESNNVTNTVSFGYTCFKAGIMFSPPARIDWIKIVGEFGALGIFENDVITTNPGFAYGIYSAFSFEMMPDPLSSLAYTIKIEGVGMMAGGIASNLVGTPFYASGFLLSAGIRYYLF